MRVTGLKNSISMACGWTQSRPCTTPPRRIFYPASRKTCGKPPERGTLSSSLRAKIRRRSSPGRFGRKDMELTRCGMTISTIRPSSQSRGTIPLIIPTTVDLRRNSFRPQNTVFSSRGRLIPGKATGAAVRHSISIPRNLFCFSKITTRWRIPRPVRDCPP